jgi:hypothetical protein
MRKQKVPELIEFIHSKTEVRPDGTQKGVGPLIGCVIARRVRCRDHIGRFSSGISLGWSKVNPTGKTLKCKKKFVYVHSAKELVPFWLTVSEPDQFDKEEAVRIARERAIYGSSPTMPVKIAPAFDRMVDRAERYFKNLSWA